MSTCLPGNSPLSFFVRETEEHLATFPVSLTQARLLGGATSVVTLGGKLWAVEAAVVAPRFSHPIPIIAQNET